MALDKYGTGQDPYCHEGTDLLINKLGITDADELSEKEDQVALLNMTRIDFAPPPYNLDYLCKIHQALFGDIYTWAGLIRTVDISKGDTRFCTCSRIEAEASKLFRQLEAADYLAGVTRGTLVDKIAEFYVELNMVHPFRDGNGRTQRILFEHLVINCGYGFSLLAISTDAWVEANVAGYIGDYAPMKAIFEQCIGQELHES